MATAAVLDPPGAPSSTGAGPGLGVVAVWTRLAAHVAGRIYRSFLLTLLVVAVAPTVGSWSSFVVRSGSMEPALSVGDVVVAQPFAADREQVPLGRVVVFRNPAKPDDHELLVHRVVERLDSGEFTTAGDANSSNDVTPITGDDVEARARLLVPFVGRPLTWAADGNPVPLVLWGGVTVLAFVLASRGFGRKGGRGPGSGTPGPGRRHRGWPRRRATAAVVPALAMVAAGSLGLAGTATAASAGFTDRTVSAADSWSTADDWSPPVVTMQNPGSPLKDTVGLTATASDSRSGIQSVALQYLPVGGSTWVTVCTATSAPYSCLWNTKSVSDGAYDLRAVATDKIGLSTTSDPVRTTVANNLLVVLNDPSDVVRGTTSLSASLFNTGGVTYTVRIEYSVADTNSWKTLCTNLTSPYTCSWVTTSYANGDYDLRAVAVAGSSSTPSAVVPDILVDNQAPTVAMTDPGSPLSGVRTFAATASDLHSGIAQVVIQYATTGTSTYRTLCTLTTEPYSCRVDTTTLTDGTYGFRAVATDAAGNVTASALVGNRVVDNTVSAVSMEDPGAFLAGTVTLNASASSTAGVTSVTLQRALAGTTAWTDLCTDTTAPYSCTWDTRTVTDGAYDLRAVLVDGTSKVTTSAVLTGRRVDNNPVRGYDVQSTNGGVNAGRLDSGDTMTFTYSEVVNPATITSGWTGSSTAVTLRVRDGALLGLGGSADTVDVLRTGAAVNLGTVNLKGDYVKSSKSATFNATMTAATVTVAGVPRTVVTVRLGTQAGGNGLRAATTTTPSVWSPLSAVTDLSGKPCSTAPVTELGALDREF